MSRRLTAAFLAMTLGTASAHAAGEYEKAEAIDMSKTFNMEVQLYPFTDPTNPESRMVSVDCRKLDRRPSDGKVVVTGSFADQFDLPPLRPKSNKGDDITQGTAALIHLGSFESAGHSHQISVAAAELFSGKAARNEQTRYRVQNGSRTYHTSVSFVDDRYSPVHAAQKLCTLDPNDDQQLSPIYKVLPGGDVTLDSAALNSPQNLPDYTNYPKYQR